MIHSSEILVCMYSPTIARATALHAHYVPAPLGFAVLKTPFKRPQTQSSATKSESDMAKEGVDGRAKRGCVTTCSNDVAVPLKCSVAIGLSKALSRRQQRTQPSNSRTRKTRSATMVRRGTTATNRVRLLPARISIVRPITAVKTILSSVCNLDGKSIFA